MVQASFEKTVVPAHDQGPGFCVGEDAVEGRVAMTTKVLCGAMFALMLMSSLVLAQTRLSPIEKGEQI